MSMGNYLGVGARRRRMATNTASTGLDHPTVVPENFEPPADDGDEEGDED